MVGKAVHTHKHFECQTYFLCGNQFTRPRIKQVKKNCSPADSSVSKLKTSDLAVAIHTIRKIWPSIDFKTMGNKITRNHKKLIT